MLSALPSLPSSSFIGGVVVESDENPSRVFSDDLRSDHGVRVCFRNPPLSLQPVQRRVDDGFNLPSEAWWGIEFSISRFSCKVPSICIDFSSFFWSINLELYFIFSLIIKFCFWHEYQNKLKEVFDQIYGSLCSPLFFQKPKGKLSNSKSSNQIR